LFAHIYIIFQKSPYGLVTFRPVKDDHFLKVSPDKLLMCHKVHADSVLLAMARDEGFPFCKFTTKGKILNIIINRTRYIVSVALCSLIIQMIYTDVLIIENIYSHISLIP